MHDTRSLKSGDKVRAVASKPGYFDKGEVLTVISVSESGEFVRVVGQNGSANGFWPCHFEKIEESEIKAGDTVRCTRSYGDQFTAGNTYLVTEASGERIGVALDDRGSRTNGWQAEYFKKIEQPKPAPAPLNFRIRELSPCYFAVERRTERFDSITSAVSEAEARAMCDALNKMETT